VTGTSRRAIPPARLRVAKVVLIVLYVLLAVVMVRERDAQNDVVGAILFGYSFLLFVCAILLGWALRRQKGSDVVTEKDSRGARSGRRRSRSAEPRASRQKGPRTSLSGKGIRPTTEQLSNERLLDEESAVGDEAQEVDTANTAASPTEASPTEPTPVPAESSNLDLPDVGCETDPVGKEPVVDLDHQSDSSADDEVDVSVDPPENEEGEETASKWDRPVRAELVPPHYSRPLIAASQLWQEVVLTESVDPFLSQAGGGMSCLAPPVQVRAPDESFHPAHVADWQLQPAGGGHLSASWLPRLHKYEDAEPLLSYSNDGQRLLAAVFDGLGGAGSTKMTHRQTGEVRTGAYLASRSTRAALSNWFHYGVADESGIRRLVQEIGAGLERTNHDYSVDENGRGSSSFRRILPTTLAATLVDKGELHVLWAGDSRVFGWSGERGLQQLSIDHVRDRLDPQEQLRKSPPMNNVICLDRPFRVDHLAVGPINQFDLVLSATDGVFDDVATPSRLEAALLYGIRSADGIMDLQESLGEWISARTGDDASIAMISPHLTWSALKKQGAGRLGKFEEMYAQVFSDIEGESDRIARAELIDSHWLEYGPQYMGKVNS
jgi:serine/threonine protein phosphatase PrpC